ncbi:hypothetical protein T492DRAFT_1039759 [Pavlovales sp. CCMP2436]|nr:hypothetical protein T492DRAFT_1039759 [Pavlovales sp. CCMP2436]
MLHIHQDVVRLPKRAGGAAARAPLAGKGAASSAVSDGKGAALKPRRALGDITNKNGKESAKGDAALAQPKVEQKVEVQVALKPRPSAPPPDVDLIERMFPVAPVHISLDLSGIDLDAVIDSVLNYDCAPLARCPDPFDGLDFMFADLQTPAPNLDPGLALAEPAPAASSEPADYALSLAALAGALPEDVRVDETGAVSDSGSDEEEMMLI